ncbi:unnamed protein product, partial [Rotaria magnacalcarata]
PIDYMKLEQWLRNLTWTPESIAQWQEFYNKAARLAIYDRGSHDKDTGQDIHIVTNGNMLREFLEENINQLDVFVFPPTSAPLSSSSSNNNSD